MIVVIPTDNAEFLSAILMPLAQSDYVTSIIILDNGGRACTHNLATQKVIDYACLLGREVIIRRIRKKLSMMKIRLLQIEYFEEGKPLLFLDDDIVVSSDFISQAGGMEADYVCSSVPSVDDAEGFNIQTPEVDKIVKWGETPYPEIELYEEFHSACTMVFTKKAADIIKETAQHNININEGEEVIIGESLSSCKGYLISGMAVYHFGNEWSKVDLIRKMDSMRGNL